ncbi:GGDEF domain-containing protein [Alteromonas sp. 1_MG-2023]|uniref:sensor domain-containing diguanylate cyclase n=1 Tax=Alteromonas sp. 1_MG-2023 TaxID=3062669 RepID=UPI0026E1FCCC|nr:GGDEF domain-containing protein [Alteromonas sp. 1_MG-2023]MDO6568645.1 GGDEF domain-containing protein [Alteromonas sp. 1_MG-2023]
MLSKNTDKNPTEKLFNFYQDSSLSRMINFLNEAIVVIDVNGTIEMLNSTTASLLGIEKDRLLGHNLLELVIDDTGKSQTYVIESLDAGQQGLISSPPMEVNLQADSDNKTQVCVEMSISTLPEAFSSSNTLYLCILRDLTLHKAEYGSLLNKANSDYLTGLANRHRFAEYLNMQWDVCEQDEVPLSIIFIDIDHFKDFNDQYGHIAGDRCLKRIGETISLSLPNRDTLAARYGGEEFALVLPRCSAQTAQLLAIRIKRHISHLSTRQFALSQESELTVSMGVATQMENRYRAKEGLLNAADTLLYQAKSQGRDQICFL